MNQRQYLVILSFLFAVAIVIAGWNSYQRIKRTDTKWMKIDDISHCNYRQNYARTSTIKRHTHIRKSAAVRTGTKHNKI